MSRVEEYIGQTVDIPAVITKYSGSFTRAVVQETTSADTFVSFIAGDVAIALTPDAAVNFAEEVLGRARFLINRRPIKTPAGNLIINGPAYNISVADNALDRDPKITVLRGRVVVGRSGVFGGYVDVYLPNHLGRPFGSRRRIAIDRIANIEEAGS